jgi:SPP1 gp7 family putative phage head morphogenesis protein
VKLPRTLGRPASRSHEQTLLRALVRPMLERVRATIRAGRIKTLGDCRALGVALRKAYPDERVRTIVGSVGTAAELAASRPWGRLERAAATKARKVGDAWRGAWPALYGDGTMRLALEACAASPVGGVRLDARQYDGPKLVDRWTKDATSRITSVRDEIAEGLRRDVIAAAEAGTDASELAAKWLREGVPVEWGTAEGRLRAIAQNQLGVLHAQVQSERARAVGVTAFIWRTQGDDRVRDAHQALDGTRHDYTSPPDEGLPGEPPNCRCWAESVIDDELALELGFEIG